MDNVQQTCYNIDKLFLSLALRFTCIFSLALIHSSLIHQRPQINTLRFLESPLTGESEPAFVGGLTNPFEKYAQVKLDHFQFGSG